MYRRPKFLEVLIEIRQEMAREADHDVDLFAEMVRAGTFPENADRRSVADEPDRLKVSRRPSVKTGRI